VALLDWKTNWRIFTGKPAVDAVFITNMRDKVDRVRFLGKWRPKEGHFNGPRYWLNGSIAGRTRALDITTDEMATSEGRLKAKTQFASATRWAAAHGARVIVLAAATKRLFTDFELEELKARFPGIVFTIGDNGTVLLLLQETFRALHNSRLSHGSKVAVLGPYGLIGDVMTRALTSTGYRVVGVGPNRTGLKLAAQKYGIATCATFSQTEEVDAVVACTHSREVRLNADIINSNLIRRKGKKLLLIDVAEPSNLGYKEWLKCKNNVIRQDAGNGYAAGLKYVLGAISYRMFRLTRGITFGCFAEGLCLAAALKRGDNIDGDWMSVHDENMDRISRLLRYEGFEMPSPRCFGRKIESFDLGTGQGGRT